MARRAYPSDHRRYFRVMEDILDDPGYRNLSAPDKVAWIDLLATFNRYQAHRDGNVIVLPWSRAYSVLSSQNRRAALARASRIAREVGAHFSQVPEGLLCYIPKYAKFQGLTPTRFRCTSDATPLPTPTPTPTPTPLREDPPTSDPCPADAERPAPRPKAPTPTERARAIWPRLVEAVRKHGAVWSGKPGKAQVRTVAARLAEGASEEDLGWAIRGAMSLWGDAKDDWDPVKYLRPSTLFAPTKFPEYVAAGKSNGRADPAAERMATMRAAQRREREREAQGMEGVT